jgi:hypothetical protein
MKMLFVQVTDLHIKENTNFPPQKIENIIEKIVRQSPDAVFFVFSGDIVWTGKQEEFNRAQAIINNLVNKLTQKLDLMLEVLFVPGNHDIEYEENFSRTRDEIKRITKDEYYKQLKKELIRFSKFYSFESYMLLNVNEKIVTNYKYEGKLFKKITYNVTSEKVVNFILLNNSVYTYFDMGTNEFYDNEKGLLMLPDLENLNIENGKNILNVLVMHFPIEYYNDESRDRLMKFVKDKINFVFTGHIHVDYSNRTLDEKNTTVFIASGAFNTHKNSDSEFNLIVYNTENEIIQKKAYKWINEGKYYDEYENKTFEFCLPYVSLNTMKFKENFINEFYKDDMQISNNLIDYFIFPNLTCKNNRDIDNLKNTLISNEEDLFENLSKYQKIIINGEETSGKTALSKYLHFKFMNRKLVLYSGFEDIKFKTKLESFVKSIFLEQYESNSIEEFYKYDIQDRVLIIDDMDKVHNSSKILEELSEYFGNIIAFTSNDYHLNPKEKDDLTSFMLEDILVLEIDKFYKKKRDELVIKVYSALSAKNDSPYNETDLKRFVKSFSKVIESNLTLFSLNPFMIIMMVKHMFHFDIGDDKNVFNEVFTSNITMQINRVAKQKNINNINPHFTVLQKIAFFMNKNQKNYIEMSEIDILNKDYNDTFGIELDTLELIELLRESKVLISKNNKYYFVSKNFLAYFASREYVKLSNRYEDNKEDFDNLLNNLFVGVNEKILLFLAFSQQNDRIIKRIVENAEYLFKSEKELNLDNFKFLTDFKKEINSFRPFNDKEREAIKKNQEYGEKKANQNEERSRYDVYTNEEYTELEKKFYNGINYLKLVSILLPNFIHNLEVKMQDRIVRLLYELPNKLLYYQFDSLDQDKDELIDALYQDFIKNKKINFDENKTKIKDHIYFGLVNLIRAIILSIYDMVARRSVDLLTEKRIDSSYQNQNINNQIQSLMFKSFYNSNAFKENFKEYAVRSYEMADKEKNILLKNCIKLIVRRYVLDNEDMVFHGQDRSFLNVFFTDESIKGLLISKSKIADRNS